LDEVFTNIVYPFYSCCASVQEQQELTTNASFLEIQHFGTAFLNLIGNQIGISSQCDFSTTTSPQESLESVPSSGELRRNSEHVLSA
jgi:hypothetical protein